jgi:hypothetical protein
MDIKEHEMCVGMDWIHLVQWWWTVVKMVIKCCFMGEGISRLSEQVLASLGELCSMEI